MRKQDFEFLIALLKDNAGWEFDEEQYFVVDKKISNINEYINNNKDLDFYFYYMFSLN